ncbi:MAG: hypothetical protein HZB50_18055 [Chloroflexi bacterium]|nr:hypothetical protein [Chloroflexota bacterium]
MTKKSALPKVLVIILFSCSCFALAGQYVLHGCLWWECAPERYFRVSELELPHNLFPDDLIVNHIYPLSDEHETIDDGGQSIYWDTGNAGYVIYRFPTIRRAKVGFDFNKHMLFSGAEDVWLSIADSIFPNTTADSAYIACGNRSIYIKECTMVARYQEYVVYFSAVMDNKLLYADFEKIVVYIDEQLSSRLYP